MKLFDSTVTLEYRDGTTVAVTESQINDNPKKWRTAHDFINSTKSGQYHVKSAFHKEVRRSDPRLGLMYARWFVRMLGHSRLLAYCKTILFEETKNVDLLVRMAGAGSDDALGMARLLVSSHKKHDLKCRDGVLGTYARAFDIARQMPPVLPGQVASGFRSGGDLESRLVMFWRVMGQEFTDARWKLELEMKDAIGAALPPSEWAAALMKHGWAFNPMYSAKLAIEMMSGAWDPSEANYIAPAPPPDSLVLPQLRDYAYDNHTMRGAALLRKELPNCRPGRPLPDGVDLRWSGMLRGVAWRDAAARGARASGGSASDCAWDDVSIAGPLWSSLARMDYFFYKKFHESAGFDDRGMPGDQP